MTIFGSRVAIKVLAFKADTVLFHAYPAYLEMSRRIRGSGILGPLSQENVFNIIDGVMIIR